MEDSVSLPELKHANITSLLIEAYFEVYRELGYGFLRRVYENAMAIAAHKLGLQVERHVPIRVHYQGILVGEYEADMVREWTRYRRTQGYEDARGRA